MEFRHLDALVAIAEEGSFTAAADVLATVQSNVSEHVRQLEAELGAQLLVRSRRGASTTECGDRVLEGARRIRRELEALRVDISMLQGLEAGESGFGIVGTAARWLVPRLVRDLRLRAPGIRLRVTEGASERLVSEVLGGVLAQAIVTEPVTERRVIAETILEEELVAVVPLDAKLPRPPVPLEALLELGLVLPPPINPLRAEVEQAARNQGLPFAVTVEVEGIRLIADLVAAGAGASVLPQTAVPPELTTVRTLALANMPPRRLALVNARETQLSLADRAVRECVLELVASQDSPVRPVGRTATGVHSGDHVRGGTE